MPRKNINRIALVVGMILLIPLTLTLFNPSASIYGGAGGGWDWMPGDFLFMGMLLFAAGAGIDLAARKINNPTKRTFAIIAIIAVLFLIWVELAVDAVSQLVAYMF